MLGRSHPGTCGYTCGEKLPQLLLTNVRDVSDYVLTRLSCLDFNTGERWSFSQGRIGIFKDPVECADTTTKLPFNTLA